MKLLLILAALLLTLTPGRADDQAAVPRQPKTAAESAAKPSSELVKLDIRLIQKQKDRDQGLLKTEEYHEFETVFRADLDATTAKIEPTSANAVLHAEILTRLGESGQAVASLNQALQQDPKNAPLKIAKGYALYDQRDYAAAAAAANEVLEAYPRNQDALWIKHASENSSAPNIRLPDSPWAALARSSGVGAVRSKGAGKPFVLASEIPRKTIYVPAFNPMAPAEQNPPMPAGNSSPLAPLAEAVGVSVAAYGVLKSKSTWTRSDEIVPMPEAARRETARRDRAVLLGLATFAVVEFGGEVIPPVVEIARPAIALGRAVAGRAMDSVERLAGSEAGAVNPKSPAQAGIASVEQAAEAPSETLMPNGNPLGAEGTDPAIRVMQGGHDDARALYDELSHGGTPYAPEGYPGTGTNLPNGGWVGLRTVMSNSPGTEATIDTNIPGIPINKVKFNP